MFVKEMRYVYPVCCRGFVHFILKIGRFDDELRNKPKLLVPTLRS